METSSSDSEASISDSGTDNSTSDSEAQSEGKRGADGDYKKTELIMPWHIQDSAPRQNGKREKSLITVLDTQNMANSTADRGMNCKTQSMYQYTACKSAATKHIILCIIPDSFKHSQHKRQHIFTTQTDLGTRNFKSASITRLVPTLKLVSNSLLSRNTA